MSFFSIDSYPLHPKTAMNGYRMWIFFHFYSTNLSISAHICPRSSGSLIHKATQFNIQKIYGSCKNERKLNSTAIQPFFNQQD